MCLRRLLLLGALLASVPAECFGQASDSSSEAAQRLVFLLQYVGTDYAGAVRDGKVLDESEYREMLDFASTAADQYGRIRSSVPAAETAVLDAAFARLNELVKARANPAAVRAVTESVIPALIESFSMKPAPKRLPEPQRAHTLYQENCAPCHGAGGRGDGPRAAELDPPPADFTDPLRIETVAPYVFYNAITFGVPRTAMASFRDSLTDQERWDLAFYLWTFSVPDPPPPQPVVLSLRDLAARSSYELVPEALEQAARAGRALGEAEAKRWIAELRARPRALSDHEERLARVRQDLKRSVALLENGNYEGAADLVTSSYLDDFEPLEPEIDRFDRAIRQRFERDLIDFRAALRRRDRGAAVALAQRLGETVGVAADRLRGAQPAATRQRVMFFSGVALLAIAAAALIAMRRRDAPGSGRDPRGE